VTAPGAAEPLVLAAFAALAYLVARVFTATLGRL